MVLLLLFSCLGSEAKQVLDTGDDINSTLIPSGASKALDVCEPMMQHQIIIGIERKDCDASILESYVEVIIQDFPFLQDQTYTFGPEGEGNWAIWNQGSESVVLTDGDISLDWEGIWTEGVSFSGNYQGSAPDGTLLEGFITGLNCQHCSIQQ